MCVLESHDLAFGAWRAWVARHGRRLWREHGIDGAGDVAVIVDPRDASATFLRQLTAELEVVLATDVQQDIEAG